jgi:hypothetical protein
MSEAVFTLSILGFFTSFLATIEFAAGLVVFLVSFDLGFGFVLPSTARVLDLSFIFALLLMAFTSFLTGFALFFTGSVAGTAIFFDFNFFSWSTTADVDAGDFNVFDLGSDFTFASFSSVLAGLLAAVEHFFELVIGNAL